MPKPTCIFKTCKSVAIMAEMCSYHYRMHPASQSKPVTAEDAVPAADKPTRRRGRPPVISEPILQALRRRRDEGESVPQAAKSLGISRATAYRALQETPPPKQGRPRYEAYGLTAEEYQELLDAQGGTCGICRLSFNPDALPAGRPHIDHDHVTGHVRGLLCTGCNTGIGHLGDTAEDLWNAWKYLTNANKRNERNPLGKGPLSVRGAQRAA